MTIRAVQPAPIMPRFARWQDQDLVLLCHVQPGARSSEFVGLHGDRLRVRVAAAADGGQANRELLRFVAASFRVANSQVELRSGSRSRQKTLLIRQPGELPATILAGVPTA